MNIIVKNKGPVTLTKKDFISSGGQGEIYVKGNTAFKIYFDMHNCISERKIKELAKLEFPFIIKPEDIILNEKKQMIGYVMKYIKNTVSLVQLFPRVFKERNKIGVNEISNLISILKTGINHVHSKDILVVDMNEMNFMINMDKFDKVYFIDVDSYQTSDYPAVAIMDSIRDRHNSNFTRETDWFSFGILTFQMFTGIHPYKGRHPKYNGLDERMLNNISVFNKEVTVPKIVTFDMPRNYKDWFFEIFENGQRIEPPDLPGAIATTIHKVMVIDQSDSFIISFYQRCSADSSIIKFTDNYILTTNGLFLKNNLIDDVAAYSKIGITPVYGNIITAVVIDNVLSLWNVSRNQKINYSFYAEDVFSYDDRIYVKQQNSICELRIQELSPSEIKYSLHVVANINANSTYIFDGVVIQNLLGDYFVSVFPNTMEHHQLKIKEFNGYRIVNAKYMNKVLIAVGERKGSYVKFIVKISDNDYICKESRATTTDINFTVLKNGIVVSETGEGFISVFNNNYKNGGVKLIKDDSLSGGILTSTDNQVYNIVKNKIYEVKMK